MLFELIHVQYDSYEDNESFFGIIKDTTGKVSLLTIYKGHPLYKTGLKITDTIDLSKYYGIDTFQRVEWTKIYRATFKPAK